MKSRACRFCFRCSVLSVILAMAGCGVLQKSKVAEPRSEPAREPSRNLAVLDEGYSLLYDLLSDEKDVSKLLLIKRESRQLGELIKEISRTAQMARQRLEQFARETRRDLKAQSLPIVEQMTRKSIENARSKQLLHASGFELELNLLLSQLEALTYGAHLAEVIADQETSSERVRFLRELAKKFRELHRQAASMLALKGLN